MTDNFFVLDIGSFKNQKICFINTISCSLISPETIIQKPDSILVALYIDFGDTPCFSIGIESQMDLRAALQGLSLGVLSDF